MRKTLFLLVTAICVGILLGTVHATLPVGIPEALRSSKPEIRQKTARRLAEDLYQAAVGRKLGPGHYVNIIWREADVIPGGAQELLVGATVLPDEGYLGLYGRTVGGYRLLSYVPNLSSIEEIDMVSTTQGVVEVAVTDLYDESLGAFFVQRSTRLFRWNDRTKRLHQVWDTVIFCEEYSLDPPLEEKQITRATYSFGDGVIRQIETRTNWKLKDGDYELTGKTTTEREYIWNEEEFRFIGEESH